jgi:4-oxalocrotonate tautomerase
MVNVYPIMPVVHVELYEGRSKEVKQRIVAGITDVFVKEGIPSEGVTVILKDIKKENYGYNGKLIQ